MNKKLFYILPLTCMLIGSLYYAVLLSGMYVSTTKFAVRGGEKLIGGDFLSLLGGLSSSTSSDSYIITEYIQSIDMLKSVDDKLQLREHYSHSGIDFLSRLDSSATLEDYIDYWESIVRVSYDSTTGILTVETRAYTPEVAQSMGVEIIVKSEELMNRMNDRVQMDTVHQAGKEIKLAEKRYAEARRALNTFRSLSSDIDPTATVETRFRIIAELESRISSLMTELKTQKQFMKEDSIAVRVMQGNLEELQSQLAVERMRLTGKTGPKTLVLLDQYETLSIENEFARNYYLSALGAMEAARVQAEAKSVYLEAFQHPTLPSETTYPDRLLSVLLVIVVVGMGYALLLLVIAAVKEHIGV